MVFNAQSFVSVISGRNTIHLINTPKSFRIGRQFAVFVWRGCGENEVEFTGRANISGHRALAVGKACYSMLYSYSRRNKNEPLIALGSYKRGGGVLISAGTTLAAWTITALDTEGGRNIETEVITSAGHGGSQTSLHFCLFHCLTSS